MASPAEIRAWTLLGEEADRAATKCIVCQVYGHTAKFCPELAHITEPGVAMVTTDSDISRGELIFWRVLGFLAGALLCALMKGWIG